MRSELYCVQGPWPGRLAITPRPRGGDWLEDEIQLWRRAGIDVVVSLLTDDEVADLGLSDEKILCLNNGIQFFSFPIMDRSIPTSREAFADLAATLAEQLAEGKNVAIHCRQGIGRSALLAVTLLGLAGIATESAMQQVSSARGCPVPETIEQRRWLSDSQKFERPQLSKK